MAFSTVIGGKRTIATMTAPGGPQTNLSNDTGSVAHEYPSWRRQP